MFVTDLGKWTREEEEGDGFPRRRLALRPPPRPARSFFFTAQTLARAETPLETPSQRLQAPIADCPLKMRLRLLLFLLIPTAYGE